MLQISLNTEADGSQKWHCMSEWVLCEAVSFICKMVFSGEAHGKCSKMHSTDLRTRLWITLDHLLQTSLSHQKAHTLISVTHNTSWELHKQRTHTEVLGLDLNKVKQHYYITKAGEVSMASNQSSYQSSSAKLPSSPSGAWLSERRWKQTASLWVFHINSLWVYMELAMRMMDQIQASLSKLPDHQCCPVEPKCTFMGGWPVWVLRVFGS